MTKMNGNLIPELLPRIDQSRADEAKKAILGGMATQPQKKNTAENQDQLVALLTRIADGDEMALEGLYDATVNRIYGLALRITVRGELAEEVVSDVFLQVWRQAGNFEAQRASPLAWMMMLCRTRSIDALRREGSRTPDQRVDLDKREIADDHAAVPLDQLMSGEFSQQIQNALGVLNDIQRQTIALAFYRGMSHQEVADYTGQPLGTVKSNLRRAQALLRSELSATGLDAETLYGQTR